MLLDIGHHLFVGPAVRSFTGHIFDQLVRTMAGLAVLAVHQRVGEAAHMPRCHPHLRIHQDGRIQPDVVGGLLYKLFPPGAFDIVFELNTERAVIP